MQANTQFSWERFDRMPIIGIIRGLDYNTTLQLGRMYWEAGLSTLEVTLNTPNAAQMITNLRKQFPELNIGAGTVCSPENLQMALDAGSQFIVTPILEESVIKTCVAQNVPIFPGAFTPTEIYRAWNLGASAVKVFPSTQLGPQYIKDVLGPLDQIKLIPTGGISKMNLKAYFGAGAFGFGLGSSLFDKELIAREDFGQLKEHFISYRKEVEEFFGESQKRFT